ncbi:hypothetical protein F4774DRAFT_365029 [Daldinia eschscholtzii]|nr:hypothetical protein F4774DRAFT_365029 [Daldinia eschscholtzii]
MLLVVLLSTIIYHLCAKPTGSRRDHVPLMLSLIKYTTYLETRRLRLIVSPMTTPLTSIIFLELLTAPIRVSRQPYYDPLS